MRDISDKNKSLRTATAQSVLKLSPEAVMAIREHAVPLGDPLSVAKVAAIQAAKSTAQVVPYCHALPLDFVGVEFQLHDDFIEIRATVKAIGRAGVEMEAMVAASVAALTIYDMLDSLDPDMEVTGIRLLSKKGGRKEARSAHDPLRQQLRVAVVVMSDSIAAGRKDDLIGKLIRDRLMHEGIQVQEYQVVPDDPVQIKSLLKSYADDKGMDLVLTAGGTGLSQRDTAPEVMKELIEREVPGIAEALRNFSQERMPYAMLLRGMAGLRGKTLIINLPGSKSGVRECLDALFPAVLQGFKVLRSSRGEAAAPEPDRPRFQSPDTPDYRI